MIYENIPKILYKYRNFRENFVEKMLLNGEIYFATTNELTDFNEKSAFVLSKGSWVNDENNSLVFLNPEQYKEYLMKLVKAGKSETYGILSLCDSKKEVNMYRDYADDFNGICIGFDWDKFDLFFHGSHPPIKNRPRRVIYGETIKIDSDHITPEKLLEIYCRKLKKYSYEKEYRIFYSKGKFTDKSVRYAIREIVFGYKVSNNRILEIKNLVSDLTEIDFFIARLINCIVR